MNVPRVSAARDLVRALVVLTAGLTLLLAGATTGTAATAGKAGKTPPPASPPKPVKADGDGDKIFDDLEARLASLQAGDRIGVIVSLTEPASPERVADLQRRVGPFSAGTRFSVIDGLAATVTKGQAQALTHVPWVAHVEENSPVQAFNDTAQQSFGVTKARSDVPSLDGEADGNADTYSPGDLVAAVIDTGIDSAHLDLDEGKVLAFKDFVNGRTAPYDDNGHGTHVAATIAGDGDARADRLHRGVAPAAGLVGLKVLDAAGSGTMESVTAAIDWVVQNKAAYGIEAINLSLGAAGCADGTDATSRAVNNAAAAGLVVAAAAGNEGAGTCTIGAPGAASAALTVGAMADLGAGGFSQASFSSRGKTADGRIKPDVSAPGVNITSAQSGTTTGYATMSGTSMATPFVAGLALLMRDASATLTPADVKTHVVATAVDWGRGGDNTAAGSTGADIDYGAGRLDGYAALKAAGAPLAAPPATPKHELREGTLAATGATVDYKLSVADVQFPLAATLIHSGVAAASATTPDFDLYLYGPSGSLVAASETINRQETVTYKATATGTYTLRVYSYSGAGGYFVDVSAGLGGDTVAPTVASVSPVDGATGVAATTKVSATFSEAMDAAATQAGFSLVRASDGAAISGSYSWSGSTLTFTPSAALASGTAYRAKVAASAKDLAGNALGTDKVWSFTVATASTAVAVYPSSTAIYYGTLRSGAAARLGAADSLFYEVNSTTSGTRLVDWYARGVTVPNTLKSLKVTYRGKSSATCEQRLGVYNWTTGAWVWLNTRSAGTSLVDTTVSVGGTLADYVSGTSGDGDVAVRIRCSRTDAVSFFGSGDLLQLEFTR